MGEVIYGRALFEKLLERPQSLFDRLWEMAVSEAGTATPEQRAGLKLKLLETAAIIQHPEVRAQYRKMFLDRFDATFYSRRPAPAKRPAPVVDMRAFAARRNIPDDAMVLLTKLSAVEEDIKEVSRLLTENWTDAAVQYQQDLLRMKMDIQRQIIDFGGGT